MPPDLKQKIIDHLNGLNEVERKSDSSNLINVIAERYDVSPEMVEKTIAEWEAGRGDS